MPRPQKNTVDYFRHFTHQEEVDAADILWKSYKKAGYALYYRLREKLGHSDGHYLDLRNPVKWRQFLAFVDVEEVSTVEMINLLVEIGEIDQELWDSKIIWWQSYVDDLSEVYENRKREIPQKPIITGDNEIITPNYSVSTPKNGVSAGERVGEGRKGEGRGGTSTKKKGNTIKKKSSNRERGTESTTLSSKKDGKEKRVRPAVIKIEKFLEENRGAVSPEPKEEREYIELMLNQGFTVQEICDCYVDYKEGKIRDPKSRLQDTYWVGKFLSMKSLYKQIPDWRKKKNRQSKYSHLIRR